ncbi:MAG: NUDIX hydrolase [Bacteroidota bacterium]
MDKPPYRFEFTSAQPDDAPNPWKTLTQTEAYANPWIRVSHREVLNPSGGKGIYGVVHFKNIAVGIVPLDEDNNTWLVGQYRYTLERYSWEIPEGGCLKGDSTLEAAKRELLEETGITAREWIPLMEMHTSNSVTDEYGLAYIARGLSFGEAQPEETEELHIRKLPFAEVFRMVMDGEITDAFSMIAILKTEALLRQGLI